jgi:hypothetical protein
MGKLRSWARSGWWLALCLLALTLATKVLVPQGYMIVAGETATLQVSLCSGMAPQTMAITVPVKSEKGGESPGKALPDQVCPFAALGHAAMSGPDLALLLEAIIFVLALGLAPRLLPRLAKPSFLTPPLRGPPAFV